MPGHHHALSRDPDRLGSYPVVCNLLCGVGHSLMRSTVHVVHAGPVPGWIEPAEHGLGRRGRHERDGGRALTPGESAG